MAHSKHATLILLSEVLALGFEDVSCMTEVLSESLLEMQHRFKSALRCRFFITTVVTSWLDGRHVVFGKGRTCKALTPPCQEALMPVWQILSICHDICEDR